MNGVELIAQERQRQAEQEGFTSENDEQWTCGELTKAAAFYALYGVELPAGVGFVSELWPWSMAWCKPKNRLRNLARAGALIAAEIDRLQQADEELCQPVYDAYSWGDGRMDSSDAEVQP
jgi:hypothetical protein